MDGIVGWLALFSYVVSETRRLEEKTLKRFQDMAIKLVESEIKKLERRSRRYISILKAISIGIQNRSKIKAEVERMEGVIINNASFDRSLNSLIKMGYVEKRRGKYYIVDSIINEAVKRLKKR